VPGREYVVYPRWGGGLKLDMQPPDTTALFQCTFTGLASGPARKPSTAPGGGLARVPRARGLNAGTAL